MPRYGPHFFSRKTTFYEWCVAKSSRKTTVLPQNKTHWHLTYLVCIEIHVLCRILSIRALWGLASIHSLRSIHLRLPQTNRELTLALPCGGLSAISQFLAESDLTYKVVYYYDLDPALAVPIEALRGECASGLHLGAVAGYIRAKWLVPVFSGATVCF